MDKTLSGYLDQVDRRLRPLPAGERADIILEIRSEILELEAAGAAPEEILSRLGEARGLAAAYLGDTISKKPSFSLSRLGAVAAFWGLAGLGGMLVLPFTSVLAVSLLVSGALIPAAGLAKFLASLAGIDLPFIMFQIGGYMPPPATAFKLSVVAGALLLLAGQGLWRLTVRLVRLIGQQHRRVADLCGGLWDLEPVCTTCRKIAGASIARPRTNPAKVYLLLQNLVF